MLLECLLTLNADLQAVSALASLLDRYGALLRDLTEEDDVQKVQS